MTLRRSASRLRYPETLESRAMLAGHGGGAALAHALFAAAGRGSSAIASAVSSAVAARDEVLGSLGEGHCGEHAARTSFTAALTDPNNADASGTASVTTKVYDDETETKVTVSVTGATASSTFDILLDGTTKIGTITTDATGAGKAMISSEPEGTEQQLPTLATPISDTTTISVDTLSGTFVASTTPATTRSVVSASLTDINGGTGTGTAIVRSITKNGETSTKFAVSVTGAEASAQLDVLIDGISVGTINTNANGNGKLFLSSLPTGVSVTPGTSIVTIGTLSGTFETATSATLGFGWGFGRHR